jgi:acyl carrier protein
MQAQASFQTIEAAGQWLIEWMAAEMNLDPRQIAAEHSFLSHGMDSMHAMMLVGDLEGRLGVRLSPTLVWDYPTIGELARIVVGQAGAPPVSAGTERKGVPSRTASPTPPDARAILAQLDGMSEAEMDSLLEHFLDEPA